MVTTAITVPFFWSSNYFIYLFKFMCWYFSRAVEDGADSEGLRDLKTILAAATSVTRIRPPDTSGLATFPTPHSSTTLAIISYSLGSSKALLSSLAVAMLSLISRGKKMPSSPSMHFKGFPLRATLLELSLPRRLVLPTPSYLLSCLLHS